MLGMIERSAQSANCSALTMDP